MTIGKLPSLVANFARSKAVVGFLQSKFVMADQSNFNVQDNEGTNDSWATAVPDPLSDEEEIEEPSGTGKGKFDVAKELASELGNVRKSYLRDLNSDNLVRRQWAVAVYLFDELSLRPGWAKQDGDETVQTIGCTTLKVGHIGLQKRGENYVVVFLFKGKVEVPFLKSLTVTKLVFETLESFVEDKKPSDALFSEIQTQKEQTAFKDYIKDLMPEPEFKITAYSFRYCNASCLFEDKLIELTKNISTDAEKRNAYKEAKRCVAEHLNHRNQKSKGAADWKSCLDTEINSQAISSETFSDVSFQKLKEKLEENSQLNCTNGILSYIDPRITFAWCKKWGILVNDPSIEKGNIFSTTLMNKFGQGLYNETPMSFKFHECSTSCNFYV